MWNLSLIINCYPVRESTKKWFLDFLSAAFTESFPEQWTDRKQGISRKNCAKFFCATHKFYIYLQYELHFSNMFLQGMLPSSCPMRWIWQKVMSSIGALRVRSVVFNKLIVQEPGTEGERKTRKGETKTKKAKKGKRSFSTFQVQQCFGSIHFRIWNRLCIQVGLWILSCN